MRNLIIGVVAIGALVAAFAAGDHVGNLQGRVDAAEEIKALTGQVQTLTASNAQLLLGVAAQNQAVAVAEAQAEGAKLVQAEAQKRADEAGKLSENRLKRLDKALESAKTADDVLNRYWEIRQ